MYRKVCLLTILVILALGVGVASAQRDGAQLRFAHLALDVEEVDVYVDGETVLQAFGFYAMSDHLPLDPGLHTVVVTQHGGSSMRPLVDSVRVQATDGHNYLVAFYGTLGDETLEATLIDETAVLAEARLDTTGEQMIVLNALSGGPELDLYVGDERQLQELEFGEIGAMNYPLAGATSSFVESGSFGQSLLEMGESFGLPNNTSLLALVGDYETGRGGAFVSNWSPLTIPDYLAGYRSHVVVQFNTFVEALETAGLTETLNGEGPFTVFAPSDDVFEEMPQDELDALLANPTLLASTLRYHIVPERVTVADIRARADGGVTRLTTLDGLTLTLRIESSGAVTINDSVNLGGGDLGAKNGVVYFIDGVLQQSANPENTV